MVPETILMVILLSFGTKVLKKSFWFIVFLAGISLQEFDETNEALLALLDLIPNDTRSHVDGTST